MRTYIGNSEIGLGRWATLLLLVASGCGSGMTTPSSNSAALTGQSPQSGGAAP